MTVNSLDEPEDVRPHANVWHRYAMDWMKDIDSLETHEEDLFSQSEETGPETTE